MSWDSGGAGPSLRASLSYHQGTFCFCTPCPPGSGCRPGSGAENECVIMVWWVEATSCPWVGLGQPGQVSARTPSPAVGKGGNQGHS